MEEVFASISPFGSARTAIVGKGQPDMKPLCVKVAGRATVLAALGLIGVIVAERPMQAAGQAEPVLRPTPLVLKDGRIANVSIHEVPFARGQAGLTTEAGTGLGALTRAVGTDCFLTAQVIGHIDSGEIAEQDSLSAHRLARARADAVQASLIHGGLPAKAIASVWDWQFMVREARATLWVFQLTAGEDCDGRPLREDLVAQAPTSQGQPGTSEPRQAPVPVASQPAPERAEAAAPPAPARATAEAPATLGALREAPREAQSEAPGEAQSEAPREAPRETIVSAMAPSEPAPERSVAEPRRPQATTPEPRGQATVPTVAAAERAAAAPVAAPRPPRGPADASRGDEGLPDVTQPRPPAAADPAQPTVAAAARDAASTPSRPPQPAGTDGKIETAPEGGLVITFATNSSYFPPGTSRRLRQLLAELEPGERYEASVQVAVSGARKVVGAKSAQEAARYNKWLAERRLERVQQWLLENASPDALAIRPEYRADDESRHVIVRLAPAG